VRRKESPLHLLFPYPRLQFIGRNFQLAMSHFLTSPASAENCVLKISPCQLTSSGLYLHCGREILIGSEGYSGA
jgi:hypothetical protein